MPYNPQIHHRRSIRLKGYDYTQPGGYFVTICTKEKQCLFGDIVQRKMRFNSLGAIAFNTWQQIAEKFSHVELDYFIIMPNHIHGILIFNEIIADPQSPVGAKRAVSLHQTSLSEQEISSKSTQRPHGAAPKSLGAVVGWYKSSVSKSINRICNNSGQGLIWQRDYYEEIIRDETALNTIRKYIIENPLRWEDDPEHPPSNKIKSELLIDLPF
ncbi:MAG TPA: transposase [Candidatus Obscuribacterales bacterium]